MHILAEEAGIKRDMIRSILRGHIKTVEFDVADRILTAMDKSMLWYCEPTLAAHYFPPGE